MNHQTENQSAYKTLAAYLSGGRLPHAILVEGPSGPGKDAFTARVAAAALCEAPMDKRPCGECKHCVKAGKNIHPDILRYGGDAGARSFHIDTVRELRKEAYVRPNEAEGKVLILREAQGMSVQAQNALLKVIEEPPRNVTFVLTCENKSVLLETVLSRVAAITLDGAGERPEADGEDGGPDAMQFLFDACVGDELAAMAVLAAYERNRPGFRALMESLGRALADALIHGSPDERMRRLVSRYGHLPLAGILAIIDEAGESADRNANGLLLVTSLTARIRARLE